MFDNIDSIISYCKTNKVTKFNFEGQDKLRIKIPTTFEIENEDEENQLLYCKVKLLHTGKNRNHSSVTYEAAKKSMDGIKYKPLLANIYEFEDGVKDFTSHDMYLDDNGKTVYIERQIGCFTNDKPTLEKDENSDRYYLYARVAIPTIYTDAAEIIKRKNGTKISAELTVYDMSFDANENILILNDIEISGATCLGKKPETGKDVVEGMEGARLDIECYSSEVKNENSNFSKKLIELLENISTKLDTVPSLSNNADEKGGKDVNYFQELLVKYNKTVEDIDFDYENMSDEELENKFAELFSEKDIEESINEPSDIDYETDNNTENDDINESNDTDVVVNDDVDTVENNEGETYSYKYSVNDAIFSISLDEIQYAISTLVNETYGESDNAWYFCKIYPDSKELVMVDEWTNTAYRQSFKERKGDYSLVGDRIPVKAIYVTADEEKILDDMKKNYSKFEEISIKLDKYEKEPNKIKVLESDDYASIRKTSEFMELNKRDIYFDLTEGEIKQKADEILLAYAKSGKLQFESDKTDIDKPNNKVNRISFMKDLDKKKIKSRYGNLFHEK